MKTVETKVDTFQAALGPAGQPLVPGVPLLHFLKAYRSIAKPIPEEKLRGILADAKTKDDLPYLWSIYRGYECLEKMGHVENKYQRFKDAIVWKIEEIILQAIKLPENQLPEPCRVLYDACPATGATREEVSSVLVRGLLGIVQQAQKGMGFDPEQVSKNLALFKGLTDGLRNNYEGWINAEIRRVCKASEAPEETVALLGGELTQLVSYTEKVELFEPVVRVSSEPELLLQVIDLLEAIPERLHSVTQEDARRLMEKAWLKVLPEASDEELLWRAIEQARRHGWQEVRNNGMLRLMNTCPLTTEKLDKLDGYCNKKQAYENDSNRKVVEVLVDSYEHLLKCAEEPIACSVYKHYEDGETGTWRPDIRNAAVRRLYELSQSK